MGYGRGFSNNTNSGLSLPDQKRLYKRIGGPLAGFIGRVLANFNKSTGVYEGTITQNNVVDTISVGTEANTAGSGVAISASRLYAAKVCSDDGGANIAESVSGLRSRFLLTIDQSAGSIRALQGQLKLLNGIDVTTGIYTASQGYVELAATHSVKTGATFSCFDASLEIGTALTVDSGGEAFGIHVETTGAGTITNNGTCAAIGITKASGAASWPVGLLVASSTTGVSIGAATTGLAITGATTDAISISGDATNAINITSGCSPSGAALLIAGAAATSISITGASTTAINISGATTNALVASTVGTGTDGWLIKAGTSSARLVHAAAGATIASYVNNSADSGSVRNIIAETQLTGTSISTNLYTIRGYAEVGSGCTVAGASYIAGIQGKLAVTGTMNHADSRLCAALAQLDISAGTYTTGQLSALWVDCGATAASAHDGGGQFNVLRLTNTTQAIPNAVVFAYANASYFAEFGEPGSGTTWHNTRVTPNQTATCDGWIKVSVDGKDLLIPLYSAATIA
jgi:hypothetical protein